jgi:hypothetical protein
MSISRDIRLMVKRVFITSDLGEDAMPKWASWIKVVIDGLFFFPPRTVRPIPHKRINYSGRPTFECVS